MVLFDAYTVIDLGSLILESHIAAPAPFIASCIPPKGVMRVRLFKRAKLETPFGGTQEDNMIFSVQLIQAAVFSRMSRFLQRPIFQV